MNSFKTFTDFGKGLEEIVEFIPEIKEITSTIAEDVSTITPKELTSALIEIVMNDFPYVDFRSPAISVSYKEVGFKSRSILSFGWKYINDGSGKLSYSFRISLYSHSRSTIETEKKLAENGWDQPQDKKSYFPYKNNFYKKEEDSNKSFKHDKKKNGFNKKNKFVKKEEPVASESEEEINVIQSTPEEISTEQVVVETEIKEEEF